MIETVVGYDGLVCEWVAPRLGYKPEDLAPCTTMAFVKDKKIICGVVYNNFFPLSRDIDLSIAADNPSWISRKTLNDIFSYVFVQLGCIRLSVKIKRKNKRARRLAEGLGFKYEGNKRMGYDGIEDAIFYGMLHKECNWIGERNGQKHASTA